MKLNALAGLMPVALLVVATACTPLFDTPPATSSVIEGTPLPPTATLAEPESEAETAPAATATPAPTETSEPLAALVNGQPVTLADYERALGQYEADLQTRGVDPGSEEGQLEMTQARTWIINVLIEQALTEQAAAEAGIVVSDTDVDTYMQELVGENGGEEAFRAKLAERGETYESAWKEVRAGLIGMAMTERISEGTPQTTEHVHARHILVDTPEEAASILAQLKSGADFAQLAQAYSLDTSTKDTGGDLGFFPRGILVVPEVEEAAFALEPGQFSEVVSSSLGYHIVQVIERDPAGQLSPDNLRMLQDRAVQEWIEGLWAQADIQRFVETAP
jgi:parvulin-like peptidyl-prolyl isomerase